MNDDRRARDLGEVDAAAPGLSSLRDWAGPEPGPKAEPEAIDEAVRRAASAAAGPDSLDAATLALLEPPALAAEPGEGEAPPASVSAPPTSMTRSAAPPGSRRSSLKDIAARASAAGSVPPSQAATGANSHPATTTTTTATTAAAATWGSSEEESSGLVNLKSIRVATAAAASASPSHPPASAPGAAGAPPHASAAAQASDGEAPEIEPEVEPEPASGARVAAGSNVATLPARRPGRGGAIAGLALAVVGIAAAALFVVRSRGGEQAAVVAPSAVATAESPSGALTVAQADPPARDPNDANDANDADDANDANALRPDDLAPAPDVSAGPTRPDSAPAPHATALAMNDPKSATSPPVASASPSGTPGDLKGAMKSAVGDAEPSEDAAEPASAPGKKPTGNQTVPEQPSQGTVQGALASVQPAAKACIAGADDVTRATITFSSAGTVQSVSVTGWAAANGKVPCVKAALQRANVGPFQKATFTFGMTLRP